MIARNLTLLPVACCLLPLASSACSSLPPEFFAKDRSFNAYGVYNVNPTTGISGLGVVSFESKSAGEDKIAAIQEELATLKKIIFAMIAELHSPAAEKQKGVPF